MSDKNIYQRVAAVMGKVDYVQKDAEVQGYKAVTHDQVTAHLRKELIENGIVVQVELIKGKYVQLRGANPKAPDQHSMHLYQGRYRVSFVNIDNPEDRLVTVMEGHATDTGDKAPGKATSYATKYAMLKTFSLETGEDDEARMSDPFSPEQFEVYHDLLENKKAYEFYMFVKSLPPETQTGLVNSFPDGQKVKGRKAAAELEKEGYEVFDNTVMDVVNRLDNQDISVIEITSEMNPLEKRLLAGRLSQHQINQLKKMSEAAQ